MFVVSSDHISWDDQNFLDAGHPGLKEVFKGPEGWGIKLQDTKGLSQQFANIFAIAENAGHEYVMIHHSAKPRKDLKIFHD